MHLNLLNFKKTTSFNQSCIRDTNILLYNNKHLINFINLYGYINQAFKLKNVHIEKMSFFLIGKNLLINLIVYYGALKLSLFKKRSKQTTKMGSRAFFLCSRNSLFPKSFIKTNKLNSATINFLNINKEINIKKSLILYKSIKNSIFALLKKKRYLLIDFIRVTTLLIEGKISIKFFTNFIGQIFSTLPKKSHNRFFLILKKIFKIIISDTRIDKNVLKIEGIKLKMSGRLRGKTRSDVRIITVGTVPLQSNSKHIEYFRQHLYTMYGAFGLKLWVFRNEQK